MSLADRLAAAREARGEADTPADFDETVEGRPVPDAPASDAASAAPAQAEVAPGAGKRRANVAPSVGAGSPTSRPAVGAEQPRRGFINPSQQDRIEELK